MLSVINEQVDVALGDGVCTRPVFVELIVDGAVIFRRVDVDPV